MRLPRLGAVCLVLAACADPAGPPDDTRLLVRIDGPVAPDVDSLTVRLHNLPPGIAYQSPLLSDLAFAVSGRVDTTVTLHHITAELHGPRQVSVYQIARPRPSYRCAGGDVDLPSTDTLRIGWGLSSSCAPRNGT